MKANMKKVISNPGESLERLIKELEKKVNADQFIHKAVKEKIDDLNHCDSEDNDTRGVMIGSLSDQDLIDLLGEEIYLSTLIQACEKKAEAAKRRHRTVMDRFKQIVCDRFDLPDDEPIKIDIKNMKVLRGDREARIEDVKSDVYKLFEAEEEELKKVIRKEGEGNLESDLAILLMGDRKEASINLCKEVFQAKEEDREFLEKVMNDDDVPKPIRVIAEFIMKERKITCRREKIIEWR